MTQTQPLARMVEYEEADARVRAVYDDILATKGIKAVPNFWKTLGSHPPLLEDVWANIKRTMTPGRLDALTKEMIAIAVSAAHGCDYCLNSHTAAARKLGLDDTMLGELLDVVGAFSRTNKLADAYQVPVDEPLARIARGES
ncbi:MAG: carboxymuconolactone decarboxylase family protein [Alphaproteobacteria bacterium]|nr:carboxymuconolactone decarboxylase family protein [Alphaproteobacteria bacterium]